MSQLAILLQVLPLLIRGWSGLLTQVDSQDGPQRSGNEPQRKNLQEQQIDAVSDSTADTTAVA
jgi:hypothetical protein